MNKYIISFASKGYYSLQDRFEKTIIRDNYKVYSYSDRWLKFKMFYYRNNIILSKKRGAGYWLWKPFIIKDCLSKMKNGDLLLYSDVDIVLLGNIELLFDICEKKDIVLFRNSYHKNAQWTKRDCFVLMDADTEYYYNSPVINAGFLLLKKTDDNMKLIEDWLNFSCDYRILTDSENELAKVNLDNFIEHRHDQSILGILAAKRGIELFRDPSEYGNMFKVYEQRVKNEYLELGYYCDELIMDNSTYGTLITQNSELNDDLKVSLTFSLRVKRFFKHLSLLFSF